MTPKDYPHYKHVYEFVGLEDVKDTLVTIEKVKVVKGVYGNYLFMVISSGDAKTVCLTTHAVQPLSVLSQYAINMGLPVKGRFTKHNNKWFFGFE